MRLTTSTNSSCSCKNHLQECITIRRWRGVRKEQQAFMVPILPACTAQTVPACQQAGFTFQHQLAVRQHSISVAGH